MKKLFATFLLISLCTLATTAQEAYFLLYNSQDWVKLEKKLNTTLQKGSTNVIENYVAGLMFSHNSYSNRSLSKAYSHFALAKNEFSKLPTNERNKYARFVSAKKIQSAFDDVCQQLFDETLAKRSVEQCNSFLKNYKKANTVLLDSMAVVRNSLAFEVARQQNSVAAYNAFLKQYPKSAQVQQVVNLRDKLAYEQAVQQNSVVAFSQFLRDYGNSEYAPQIQQKYIQKIFNESEGCAVYADYEQFVRANPKSKLSVQAVRRMMDFAIAQKSLSLMQKTVEYSREIDFEHTLYEFYKAFTYDGESLTLYAFTNMYPRTFLDTLIAKDFKVAAKGDNLDLVAPYDSAKWYKPFAEYIQIAAPKEKAFVVLQKMISNDIAEKNWKNATKTVLRFKKYFGDNCKNVNELLAILATPTDKTIQLQEFPQTINSADGGEYSPIISADNRYLYFCGKNRPDNIGGEDIFVSEWENGEWVKPHLVQELSTPQSNEAVISASTDGRMLLYFKEGVIYSSQKSYGVWETGMNVSPEINNARWSADAMITSDGNAIIFSSVRDEGLNYFTKQNANLGVYHGAIHHQSDIYVSLKTENGWGKPINLGPTINTIFTDRSPYLHHDMKTLYFSSDGHGGLGNLDVFVSTRLSDTCWDCWSEPINLGKEINSSEENWGYRIAPNGKDFYLAARKTGETNNDLFYIAIPNRFRPEEVVNVVGKIVDTKGKPVGTKIVWEDLASGEVIEKSQSDPIDGKYFTVLPNGKMYGYYVDDEQFYPQSQNVDLTQNKSAQTVENDIVVTTYAEMKDAKIPVRLNNLFFNTDKSDLLPYSIPELKRVAKILIANNLQVEIAGHTDNIGNDDYNMALSLRRAESVKAFLVREGCPETLFKVVGYGESKPTATNATERGRALNRRVEMRFL